eukprot:SAG31_NODE_33038_length_348_cov_1.445783_1_plen_39_part_01
MSQARPRRRGAGIAVAFSIVQYFYFKKFGAWQLDSEVSV